MFTIPSFLRIYEVGINTLYDHFVQCAYLFALSSGGNGHVPQFDERRRKFRIHTLDTMSVDVNGSIKYTLTLRFSTVSNTSSPRINFKKTLLKFISMMRESSMAFATNWPITLKIWVRFLD